RYTAAGAVHNPAARNMKTCSTSFTSCTTLVAFDSATATQTALGAASTADRDEIIAHAKGLDVKDENGNGVGGSTAASSYENRPSMHGDVIHSQPVAINFGTQAAPKVVVFYGSNDGAFRAINGNRTDDLATGVGPGAEVWSFMPPEFFPALKRLRDNTTQVKFPNVTATTATAKDYGVDGPVSAHVTSSSAWVYAGLRRGGRALYAFNVNTTDPTQISLKWKVGCPNLANDTGCTTGGGFDGMGQTWSAPKPITAPGYSGTLLVMGGGYDKCEDSDPHTCTASTKGKYVYVMDADTGSLLKTFTTVRGVIADIAVARDVTTNVAKFLYIADLGGNVFRVDVRSGAPSSWTMVKIASLGCADVNSCTNNRKFMFRPDVLEYGGEFIVMLGSGDREKPLDYSSPSVVNSIGNRFFMLRDRPDDATWLTTETTNCTQAVMCLNSLVAMTYNGATPSTADLAAKKGWAMMLRTKEQVVTTSITIFGTVTYSTHQPQAPVAGQCTSNLGQARVYNQNYATGAPTKVNRSEDLPPVGLPPSPVAGMVTLDNGKTVPFCIGCDPTSPLEASQPPLPASATPSEPKRRVYWFIER
ncbi:MAG: pilus assembly protein PilY, partial [Proteobacteria bacterium]